MNGDYGVYASGRDHRVMSNRVGSFIELGMEKEMSKWSRKVKRVLSAVGISVLIAVNAASFSMNASAATIIADSVMIRDDASTDAGIIGSLNEGDEVTIVDQVTDGEGYIWYYVQLENGNYGYVRSDLVDADENEKQIGRDEEENEPQESQEETQEETQEEASEQAQKEENAEQADAQEQEAGQAAAADTSEKTNAAVSETEEKDGAFDALTDEKSDLSVRFDKEPDGTGRWYVYNNDNNTRYRIVEEGEAAAAGGPGMWRPAAIIFGLLALALAAIAALLFKNIRDARSRNSRRRSLEVAGYAPFDENEEEEEEDEFYFEDDDDEDLPDEEEEKAADSDSDDGSDIDADSDSDALTETVSVSREKRGFSDSTIEAGIPEEAVTDEIDAEEIVAGYAGAVFEQDQADEEISAEESEPSEQEEEENGSAREDLIDQEEISVEEDTPETEADYAADDEEEFEETAGTKEADFEEAEFEEAEFEEAEFEEVEPEEVESEEVESEDDFEEDDDEEDDYEEDDDEDDDEDQPGASSKGGSFWSRLFAGKSSDEDEEDEEDQDYEEDEDYEEDGDEDTEPGDADSEEDYEDEYEDDDTEDDDDLMSEDDYDDEEEEEERPSRSARRAGSGKENSGFMGFLKKLFGSESGEDEEEDYGDDEEGPVREFDEFKEYPEDIDLLPREDSTDDAGERLYEEDYYGGDDLRDENRGRLSMQRVMKNVSYKEEEADFSQDGIDDDSYDDLTESLFDDDDDMSFSFISNSRKK